MKLLKFFWYLIKYLVIYTLSVIPASFHDAWCDVKTKNNWKRRDDNSQVRFEGYSNNGPRKHRRRGHRGGKKHRKHF